MNRNIHMYKIEIKNKKRREFGEELLQAKRTFTKKELMGKIIQMLNSVPNLTPEKLVGFLKEKNIDIFVEDIEKEIKNIEDQER